MKVSTTVSTKRSICTHEVLLGEFPTNHTHTASPSLLEVGTVAQFFIFFSHFIKTNERTLVFLLTQAPQENAQPQENKNITKE